jgi:pimeloyl-ACP methyl ester carboxylesterase
VLFAHGYVAPGEPLGFAHLELRDGTRLPDLVQQLGFAFATTTYRRTGLVVLEGVDDLLDVVERWPADLAKPDRVFVVGASDGALIATLAAEARPDLFAGGLASCGPVAGLSHQVSHVGDFRVLFDAFFPGVLPGSPVRIPAALREAWTTRYAALVRDALEADPDRARELLTVARVAFDPSRPGSVADAALALLWHNVFATGDINARLGGNAYGNRFRWYSGSSNDLLLNLRVARVDPDIPAWLEVRKYTPSGDLRIPLVVLHTTGDEQVPALHGALYAASVRPSGRGQLFALPVPRWGHCAFDTSEVLTGFALLLTASRPAPPDTPVAAVWQAPALEWPGESR